MDIYGIHICVAHDCIIDQACISKPLSMFAGLLGHCVISQPSLGEKHDRTRSNTSLQTYSNHSLERLIYCSFQMLIFEEASQTMCAPVYVWRANAARRRASAARLAYDLTEAGPTHIYVYIFVRLCSARCVGFLKAAVAAGICWIMPK